MALSEDAFGRLRTALSDRYRLGEVVGRGGMATVYRAEDLKHHRQVALKVLDPELAAAIGADRFLREIEMAANLAHPHILPLHDSGEAAGLLYYVMPFVEGESLRDRLERERQLPVEEAVRYAREVADALAFAHESGIVHRDVKPANILLEAGHAVLTDFGVAHAAAEVGSERLTRPGVSLGTAAYMSPEQVSGDRELDARSDQYALACVLYEMLVGQPPFTGPTASQVMARHLSAVHSEISDQRASVPSGVDRAVSRALEKIPADRFGSVREFGEALRQAAGEVPAPARPEETPATRIPPQPRRRRVVRWVMSTVPLAVIVIVGGILFLGSTNDLGFRKRDWILMADFQNNTGDPVFDRSLDNALAVALQQSNHLNVFPKARVSQTLQRMLREDTGEVDEELGREIARRENIKLLVVPSVDRIDQTYVLAVRVVDPVSGEDLLSRSAQADGANEVLPALDGLARRLRRDLGESRFAISTHSVPLGAATTPSLEALEAWSEGNFHQGFRRYQEARALFLRAIELDSAFAMAHADLGGLYYLDGDRINGNRHFDRALALTDRVTERERLWIAAEVQNWKENYEGAIDAYNIYLTRYPDDMDGWFRLGYAQMREGHSEAAVEAFRKVVEMDPENAAAHINLATTLQALNRREEAVGEYRRGFELAPGWITSGNLNHEYGFNFVELGRAAEADSVFRLMLGGSDEQKAQGNRSLGLLRMYQGRYRDARRLLREAIVVHQTLGYGLSEMRDRLYLATDLWTGGAREEARGEMGRAVELARDPAVSPNWYAYLAKDHARRGMVEETEALLAETRLRMDSTLVLDRASVALIRGELALAKGEPLAALPSLREAYALRETAYNLESLAYGLQAAGELEEARDRYVSLLSQPETGWEAQEYWIYAHLRLARICEALGDPESALEYDRRFLEIWKEGDADLPGLEEARRRVEGSGPTE